MGLCACVLPWLARTGLGVQGAHGQLLGSCLGRGVWLPPSHQHAHALVRVVSQSSMQSDAERVDLVLLCQR